MSSLDIDEIFQALGNETRRKILEKLAEEPTYLNRLSRELGVSQQAILKHLEFLQERGFITSYFVEGEGGTPPKKYYKLNERVVLLEELTRELFERARELEKGHPEAVTSIKVDSKELEEKLGEIEHLAPGERIKNIRALVNELDSKIEETASVYAYLCDVKNRALEIGRRSLQEERFSLEERRIIYRLLAMHEDEMKEYFEESIKEHTEWARKMMQRLSELFGEEFI